MYDGCLIAPPIRWPTVSGFWSCSCSSSGDVPYLRDSTAVTDNPIEVVALI